MTKFCTNCGAPLGEEAKFCVQCGTAVPAEKVSAGPASFCTSCGAPLDEKMQFCVQCGKAVGAEAAASDGRAAELSREEELRREAERLESPRTAETEPVEDEDEEEEEEASGINWLKAVGYVLFIVVSLEWRYYYRHNELFIPQPIQSFFGITVDKDIDRIKNSTLNRIPAVKIGPAMSRFFDDAKWTSEDLGGGRKRITVTGTCRWDDRPVKARIPFMVTKTGFHVENIHMGSETLSLIESDGIMEKILTGDY